MSAPVRFKLPAARADRELLLELLRKYSDPSDDPVDVHNDGYATLKLRPDDGLTTNWTLNHFVGDGCHRMSLVVQISHALAVLAADLRHNPDALILSNDGLRQLYLDGEWSLTENYIFAAFGHKIETVNGVKVVQPKSTNTWKDHLDALVRAAKLPINAPLLASVKANLAALGHYATFINED